MSKHGLHQQLLDASHRLVELGLNRGSSGNASVRDGDGMLITPSAMPVSEMTQASMVRMDLAGKVLEGGKPSSEWRFHRDILAARAEIGAVIHTHSTFATTIACMRRDVPAVHYMIAMAGGDHIPCTPYSVFGEQELSDHALAALQGRKACLLGNHGMIALGTDLADALAVAEEVEFVCEIYWRTLQAGGPHILSTQQMHDVKLKFVEYKKPG
ncbi:MAG TPA: class II aldolase/adducin family protein [Gallionellaceae bacterium]|nr:class II aldolase/adducin family protein [Gallionellaceae bacterium]